MKIGIGVTTYNRRECLRRCKGNILTYIGYKQFEVLSDSVIEGSLKSGDTFTLYTATDTDQDRQGVAKRKNECLRALKDCDYVFLFDDDCYPIKDGWIEFFVDTHKRTGHHHFLFLNDLHNKKETINYLTPTIPFEGGRTKEFNAEGECLFASVEIYNDCGGCFMFMTKEAIEKVGAFDEKFTPYGFEHCDWSMRCVDRKRNFAMLKGTEDYLYAEDYSNPTHKSSITDEEKKKHVRDNWDKFFKEPIKQIYIPL